MVDHWFARTRIMDSRQFIARFGVYGISSDILIWQMLMLVQHH
jgi:hypothetical protein